LPTHTDTMLSAARRLHRAGEWDTALALLRDQPAAEVARAVAEILVDRYWWRLDDAGPARAAVDRLDPEAPVTRFLRAQVAYTRLIFKLDPERDDADTVDAGFRAAAEDETLRPWGVFRLGVAAENLRGDRAGAQDRYTSALALAQAAGDLLLESTVVRHLAAAQPDRAEELLRRSLYLRAAVGARPQVAAAQVTLADALPDGAERDTLRQAARVTADELGLTWVRRAFS